VQVNGFLMREPFQGAVAGDPNFYRELLANLQDGESRFVEYF
jgi:hypothetical protein